ncbi:uncharacterized protein AB675_5243 [Cyphellophora attinorum]|uniref:DNA-binding protein RAP1 n=1 Tax=Cyphellophora attinorum TaxID=1664694 RepID=A0A0N1H8A2_9EURO|nr:uncharacterized protein AB675_5243 [Phialophora attinorum]KPI39510.1 hypothetical protein AB675_5243 [Phialophora attinorum]
MSAGIVYEGVRRQDEVDEDEARHPGAAGSQAQRLFSGLKLWFSHGVPARKWLMDNAEANGAEIVPLEKQADVRLVDHARQNQAPGTHSYRFVEQSIRTGVLEDLEAHRVGVTARVDRPVGSKVTGPSGKRNPYTEEEDQFLYNFVKPFELKGGAWKGNEIYKQIERVRPRHPYQSWRERYIKYVRNSNRSITATVSQDDGSIVPQSVELAESHQQPATVAPTQAVSRASESSPRKRQKLANGFVEPNERPVRARTPTAPGPSNGDTTRAPSPTSPAHHMRVSVQVPVRSPARAERNEGAEDVRPSQQLARMDAKAVTVTSADATEPILVPVLATPQQHRRQPSPELLTPDSQRETPLTPEEQRIPVKAPDFVFGNFKKRHFRGLFRITKDIVEYDSSLLGGAFDQVAATPANKDLGHTGRDWRIFWQFHVLPVWLQEQGKNAPSVSQDILLPAFQQFELSKSKRPEQPETHSDDAEHEEVQQAEAEPAEQPSQLVNADDEDAEFEKVACTHCFTQESNRWRRDKKGNLLCTDCWALMREGRMRSMSGGQVLIVDITDDQQDERVAEQLLTPTKSTPARSRITVGYSDAGVQTSPLRSPSPELARATHSQIDSSLSQPAPNESRKRSAGRTSQSTSQETKKSSQQAASSQGVDGVHEVSVEQSFTKVTDTPRKRQVLLDDVIEIPSTPEQVIEPEDDIGHSARPPLRELPVSSPVGSPLFFPEDDREPPPLPALAEGSHVSSQPLNVRLLSVRAMTEEAAHSDKENDDPSSESVYAFETAPNISQDWDTAPEEPEPRRERATTQALFDATEPEADISLLDLPEPDEGWAVLDVPLPEEDEINGAGQPSPAKKKEFEEVEISSDEAEDEDIPADAMDAWLESENEKHKDVRGLNRMLSTAIEATSMNFELASEIVVRMVAYSKTNHWRRLRREGGSIPPPNDVPGCWTEQDDNLLMSEVEEEWEAVLEKHGLAHCEARREWLEQSTES